MTEKDVEKKFINYVNEEIVNDEEFMQWLFKYIRELYKAIKSDCIKGLLILHFWDTIGFHTSVVVYSRRTGQVYYEVVVSGLEVTDEDILSIACNQFRINIKLNMPYYMPFPSNLDDLSTESKWSRDIFFEWMYSHNLVTKDKSELKTAFCLLLHGTTRSKELVNIASDWGIGILYHNLLYLCECWALDDFERELVCPAEITEGKARTVNIDNNDIKDNDLTGGTTLHRANMMFVQPRKWIRKVSEEPRKAVVDVRKKLKQIVTVENQTLSYESAEHVIHNHLSRYFKRRN